MVMVMLFSGGLALLVCCADGIPLDGPLGIPWPVSFFSLYNIPREKRWRCFSRSSLMSCFKASTFFLYVLYYIS